MGVVAARSEHPTATLTAQRERSTWEGWQ